MRRMLVGLLLLQAAIASGRASREQQVTAELRCEDEFPRRVLIYSAQKTGASLIVDAFGQERAITLDLYLGKMGPSPNVLPGPTSAIHLFANDVHSSLVESQPQMGREEIMKMIGDKFAGLPASRQAAYRAQEVASKRPENQVMTVVKAMTNSAVLGWQYVSHFKPDVRVLFLR
mmetsp:Transcript_45978/g.103860  ORF Transcript_45978/g.103860 Transcript_45978/m.103860 type:complete len:174 (-) Transcript_45978:632-1153(-)